MQAVEGRSIEQKRALIADITAAVVRHFDAPADRVSVLFQNISPSDVGRAGVLVIDESGAEEVN